jgi:hypothetical protein
MRRLLSAPLTVMSAVVMAPASAHHSAAMFDPSKDVTVEGTIKEWQWQNPHTWAQVMTPSPRGLIEQGFELGSPNTLVRNGFKSTSFLPGDKVTVVYHPRRDGTLGGEVGWMKGPHSNGWLKWITTAPMPSN